VGQPRPDPQASAAESLRGNAALIRALTRAVVYVQAWKPAAAAGRPTARPIGEPQGPPGRRDRGFVVDGRGYVLTNDEVVRGATVIEVTLHDGRRLAAGLVAQDPLNGVAVLKVKATGLPAIALGDSQALAAGEPVLVIGDRRGSDPTLTSASIRATGAATGGNLAIDLPVSRQGSGGPLLNRFGQAVGIVIDSAGETPTLTFAVPIDRVKPILRRLLAAPGPAVALGPER
jgi:serine protease Do